MVSSNNNNTNDKITHLAPISVLVVSEIGNEDCKSERIQSIAWSLIDANSAKVEWQRSEELASEHQLAPLLRQIDDSLPANCALVACGPLALRQHLWPAARRARCEPPARFDSYADLVREFEHRFGRLDSAAGAWPAARRPDEAEWSAQQQQQQRQWLEESAAAANQTVDFYSMQQVQADCANCHCQQRPTTATTPMANTKLRVEEMLECLSEPLAAWRCSRCLAQDQSPRRQDSSAGQQDQQQDYSALNEWLVAAMGAIIRRLLAGHSFATWRNLERIKRRVEVGLCDVNARDAEQRVVRARGLPWQATEQDIADFFAGLNIGKGGVALCLSRQGRRNGEALIQFENREQRNLALGRHRHFMGARYIEVYRASADDFLGVATGYNASARQFLSRGAQVIVRMRGLPFNCTARQVVDFFGAAEKCRVLADEDGVLFVKNHDDKPTGDAFVLFASEPEAARALQRHYDNIGSRYVELFRSTMSEVQQVLSISMERPSSVPADSPQQQQQQQQQQSARRRQTQWRPQSQQANNNNNNNKDTATKENSNNNMSNNNNNNTNRANTATYAQVATCKAQQQQQQQQRASPSASPSCSEPDNCCEDPTAPTGNGSDTSAFDNNSLASSALSSPGASDLPGTSSGLLQADESPPSQEDVSGGNSSGSASSSPSRRHHHSNNYNNSSSNNNNSYHHHHNHHQYYHGQRAAPAGWGAMPPHVQPPQAPQLAHWPTPPHHAHMAAAHHHPAATYYYAAPPPPAHYQHPHQYQQHPHQQAAYHLPAHHHPAAGYGYHTHVPPPPPAEPEARRDCIRLRGLPFEAQVEHIVRFLGDHSANILLQGVHMVYSAAGQATGEAVVQMVSAAAAQQAAQAAHRRVMAVGKKRRYIEVIPSSVDDMRPTLGFGLAPLAAASGTPFIAAAYGAAQSPHQQVPLIQAPHPAATVTSATAPATATGSAPNTSYTCEQ